MKKEEWTETTVKELTVSWIVENGVKIRKIGQTHSENSHIKKKLICETLEREKRMCDKIRDISGKIFPHEHKLEKGKSIVEIELPEEPDARDWEEVIKIFKGEEVRYKIKQK